MPKYGKQTLSEERPDLALQWHPTKNGDLKPSDVASRSGKKVWWTCPLGDDHQWEAQVADRHKGGCPCCAGRLRVHSNSLPVTHPELMKEWDFEKNHEADPAHLMAGASKRVWWKCANGSDHEWEAPVIRRTREKKIGCPVCAGKKVVASNSLATTHPEIAQEWHQTKNGELTPYEVNSGSGKKVWWKCPKGDDHEYQSAIGARQRRGCPICSGNKVVRSNSLAFCYPEIAAQWVFDKNGKATPETISATSRRKFLWKCEKGDDHVWKTDVDSRTKGKSICPVCSNKKTVLSNSLYTTHPELAAEWHPTKNGALTPKDVVAGTGKRVWWQCLKDSSHEWEVRCQDRLKSGSDCPYCTNKAVHESNALATVMPEIAKQWHPTKNGKVTASDIVYGSMYHAWWQCEKSPDHEWKTAVVSRHRSGCPYCTLTPQSRQELTITFELMLFFPDINPRGFKAKLKGRLKSIDIFMPELNLGVEFDGSYWHKDKRALDKLKAEKLREAGFEIIRIREEPLKKTHDIDIISAKPYNGKLLTNAVLSRIQELYSLPAKTNRKIAAYLGKEGLQNEAGLEAYVEQILEEKAKRSK